MLKFGLCLAQLLRFRLGAKGGAEAQGLSVRVYRGLGFRVLVFLVILGLWRFGVWGLGVWGFWVLEFGFSGLGLWALRPRGLQGLRALGL